jgi:hypothetical protein
VHYSIGSALHGFLEQPDPVIGGGRVPLKNPDGERAEEALALAAITYGEFLERSEPTIRHGVSEPAQRLVDSYFKEQRRLGETAQDEPPHSQEASPPKE